MTKPFYEVREIRDLRDLLSQSIELYGDKPAFEIKSSRGEHYELTYKEYQEQINALGTALVDMGYAGEKIAICADNCYEWALSYMATVTGVGVIVPIDRELLFDDINPILNISDVKLIFCDKKIAAKLNERKDELKKDLQIVLIREEPAEGILTINELVERGRKLLESGDRRFLDAEIDPEKMCSLLFTSGTTGTSRELCSATGISAPRLWQQWA